MTGVSETEGIQKLKTGTTTVGIVCKDCVVMGADRRSTAGNFVASKTAEKIYPITKSIVFTQSGVVSDSQLVVKNLKSTLKLKTIRTEREPTLREVANLVAAWNYNLLRGTYAISHFLIGGVDAKAQGVYEVMPDGAMKFCDDFTASGSGSVFAYGVLEDDYKAGLSEQEGINLVVRALNVALQRDSATGNGVDVYAIDKNGARKVFEKTINTGISK